MLQLAFFIIFSGLAFGQPEPEMTSTLRPGANVYSRPEFAAGSQALSMMPWNYWKERCQRSAIQPPLSGRLLWEQNDVAALQLDAPGNFCGSYFNHGVQERTMVYVRREDIARTIPRGEERTEAAVSEPTCPDCAHNSNVALLREMARSSQAMAAQKNCRKSDEELEKYLDCHATAHQANYNKYYKKLFGIAGSTFQAAYTPSAPGERGGVRAILRPEDSQTPGRRPFLVRANASVMKCIGLRESMWDPTRVSGCPPGKPCPPQANGRPQRGGAMGLGQQTQTNVAHIQCLLEGVCKQRNARTGQVETVRRAPTDWAVKLWREYFRRVKAELSPAELAHLFTNPVTGARCTETMTLKERDAPCPINSIAAIALYQVEAELTIRRASPLYKNTALNDFNENERCDLEVVQGATNNAGTGSVQRAVGQANPAQWRARLREATGDPNDHGLEADKFSKYIRNCLEAGNMNSMHDPAPGQSASRCSRYSTSR